MPTPTTHPSSRSVVLRCACGRVRGESGASSVEYALLGSLVAVVISLTVGVLGGGVGDLFDAVRWW